MTVANKVLVALLLAGATAAHAQPSGRPSIPGQFHGRWAENQRACNARAFTTVITIDRRGWSSFEEGGEVTRVGQVRRERTISACTIMPAAKRPTAPSPCAGTGRGSWRPSTTTAGRRSITICFAAADPGGEEGFRHP